MRRKIVATIIYACLLSTIAFSQETNSSSKPLTNQDVIQMISLGFSDEVIIEKIHITSNITFDTSIDGLKALKEANVTDAVIKAMLMPHPASAFTSNGRVVDELAIKFQALKNGVFTVWSEFGHGTGFLISEDGLVLTNQHVVGPSSYLALQFDEKTKIRAVLLAADPEKDVAVLWADTSAFPAAIPLRIATSKGSEATLVEGERVFTIGSPLHQQKVITSGIASKIEKEAIISDVNINHGNSGGPLFNSQGEVVGITTFGDFTSHGGPGISGILKIEEAEPIIRAAEAKMASTTKPKPTLLPVDPQDTFPIDAIKATLEQRKFDTKPYAFDEGDFDVAFITPPLKYYEERQSEMRAAHEKARRNRNSFAVQDSFRPLDDLKNWEQYIGEYEPVLLVRVTPRLRETTGSLILRSMAASGGNYAVPEKLRFKTDFYRMRLLCGNEEIVPIEPGKIAHVVDVHSGFVNATDATYEGLYSFPASAISPSCGKVTLQLYSEKKPDSAVSKELSEKTINRISDDFQPYRALHGS